MTSDTPRRRDLGARDYLEAGLHTPDPAMRRLLLARTGDVSGAVDHLSADPEGAGTFTVVGEDGTPEAVIEKASSKYLTRPRSGLYLTWEVEKVEPHSSGMRQVTFDRSKPDLGPREYPSLEPIAKPRIVTIDSSVVLAGFDSALFEARDLLFISIALEVEFTAVVSVRADRPGVEGLGLTTWFDSVPVPIDRAVLDVYRRIVGLADLKRLTRTDLLCAASAIVYRAPMFTVDPSRYDGIKNGLKLIEYGPARDTATVRRREATPVRQPRAAAPEPPALHEGTPAETLDLGYRAGREFDQRYAALLQSPELEPSALAQFIAHVLGDAPDNVDTTWRRGILLNAWMLVEKLARDDEWHGDIMQALAQLTVDESWGGPGVLVHQSQLAFLAIGMWGRWPEDSHGDLLAENVEVDISDAYVRSWYVAYLRMAGLSEDAAFREMERVDDGSTIASRERIEELRRPLRRKSV